MRVHVGPIPSEGVREWIAFARELLELLGRGGAIDAGDQEPLRLTLREQLHRLVDAGDAAGQHGYAVGGAVGVRLASLQVVGKHEKADDQP